nr:hypothetical protein [Anaeromicropila populeti]
MDIKMKYIFQDNSKSIRGCLPENLEKRCQLKKLAQKLEDDGGIRWMK